MGESFFLLASSVCFRFAHIKRGDGKLLERLCLWASYQCVQPVQPVQLVADSRFEEIELQWGDIGDAVELF